MLKGFDNNFKVILLGTASTGKTSLVNRFVDGEKLKDQPATVGVDLKSITLKGPACSVRLQIWDTAGQERFS